MPVPWPALTTLAPRFGPCRASEEERGPDRTAVKPCNPWQPDPAYRSTVGRRRLMVFKLVMAAAKTWR